jgi:hypothetical protein
MRGEKLLSGNGFATAAAKIGLPGKTRTRLDRANNRIAVLVPRPQSQYPGHQQNVLSL